ncbi:hypothetical protein KYX90_13655, partial [Enterococcus lactis]|uniref:hypothetical protein n=1 Tax=Enterococcus lactis TaxID=357441 RepID=UPI001C7D0D31
VDMTVEETLVDPQPGENIVDTVTVLTHQVMESLAPYNGVVLNSVTDQPTEDGSVTDPKSVQVVKVISPRYPEREVTVIGNG